MQTLLDYMQQNDQQKIILQYCISLRNHSRVNLLICGNDDESFFQNCTMSFYS